MDRVMGTKPATEPPHLCDSSASSSDLLDDDVEVTDDEEPEPETSMYKFIIILAYYTCPLSYSPGH